MADPVPPHVQAAAKVVDDWLRQRPPTPGSILPGAALGAAPEPTLSAAERFKRARDIDQSKMPPWRDPRS